MGQYMYENQPMKFAAIEAHWETSQPADFSILTIGDLSGKREVWSIRMPKVLSFLACNNFDCEVRGVNDIQDEYEAKYGAGDYIPLMVVTYWTFRIMMTFGFIMMGLTAFFLWANLRGDITNAKWMKWVPLLLCPALSGERQRLDPDRNGTSTLDRLWLAQGGRRCLPESHHAGPAHLADRLYSCLWLTGCCHGLSHEQICHSRT